MPWGKLQTKPLILCVLEFYCTIFVIPKGCREEAGRSKGELFCYYVSASHRAAMPERSVVVGYSSTTSTHQSCGLQGNNSPPSMPPFQLSLYFSFAKSIQSDFEWDTLIHYHSVYGLVLGRNSPSKTSLGPGKPQSRFL